MNSHNKGHIKGTIYNHVTNSVQLSMNSGNTQAITCWVIRSDIAAAVKFPSHWGTPPSSKEQRKGVRRGKALNPKPRKKSHQDEHDSEAKKENAKQLQG